MIYFITTPLAVIAWVLEWFGGSDSYDRFLDALSDMLEDCYQSGTIRTALGFTAVGFGLNHLFGTDPGPSGEMSLYRCIGALAYTGIVALLLSALLAIGTLCNYMQDPTYHVEDAHLGLWMIGSMLGIIGSFTSLGYFIVPWLI